MFGFIYFVSMCIPSIRCYSRIMTPPSVIHIVSSTEKIFYLCKYYGKLWESCAHLLKLEI